MQKFEEFLEKNNPDFFGLSAGILNYKKDLDLLNLAKKRGLETIVGGVFAGTPGAFEKHVDYIVKGKGKYPLLLR